MNTKIRSVRPLSVAKIQGVLYGILGLLVAPFFLIGPGLAMLGAPTAQRGVGFGVIVLVAAFLPFCYAVGGFLMGGLMGFLYNAVASAVGGIEIQLDPPPLAVAAPGGIAPLPSSIGPALPNPHSPDFE
jgi:hypothetical protein